MKKANLLVISVITMITLFGCKSTKDISKVNEMTELEIPLSGKEFESDKGHFRAKQVGESPDLSTAKKIAQQNAKAEMAGNIQALIKRVTEQYTNQRTVSDKKEFENKFEELSREVVNQELKDVRVIGEKLYKKKDGIYQYWIAVEIFKETILDNIENGISKDEKLQLDFDKFKFEKIFNEEMEKFEKEQNDK
ncbi:MAG: LPP20 family lipoprotein [Bacteroidetes bacterium]|nr:LPP20 family lipoprotein [Bacteroidota bacterium]